jgi:putative iron-dependent peroxidase
LITNERSLRTVGQNNLAHREVVRNMPYGSLGDHGTMFVGFSAVQNRLSGMLNSTAGLLTGTRDALTRFSQPLTGSYYFVPASESLRRLRGNPAPG